MIEHIESLDGSGISATTTVETVAHVDPSESIPSNLRQSGHAGISSSGDEIMETRSEHVPQPVQTSRLTVSHRSLGSSHDIGILCPSTGFGSVERRCVPRIRHTPRSRRLTPVTSVVISLDAHLYPTRSAISTGQSSEGQLSRSAVSNASHSGHGLIVAVIGAVRFVSSSSFAFRIVISIRQVARENDRGNDPQFRGSQSLAPRISEINR